MNKKNIVLTFLISIFTLLIAAIPKTGLAEYQLSEGVKIVSTININDARIVSQKGNIFRVAFTLTNRENVQPDVRYSLNLSKSGDIYDFVDSYTYPGTLNIGENESKTKQVTFTAPSFLRGAYDLYIEVKNKEGLTLARHKIDTLNLNGSGDYVEINPRDCVLKVEGDENTYNLLQGVDVSKQENLFLQCNVKNNGNITMEVVPDFKTNYRSKFGERVITEKLENPVQTVEANEEKTLSFQVPKALVPQSYHTKFSLKQSDRKISNSVYFQYVITGASATINNIRLNGDYYLPGDNLEAYVLWKPSADFFPQARHGGTQLRGLNMQLSVENENGLDCISDTSKALEISNKDEAQFSQEVIAECKNPLVKAQITDQKGKVLAIKELTVKSSQMKRPGSVMDQGQQQASKINRNLIVFGVLTLILVILLLIFLMKNKKVNIGAKILLGFFLATGFFMTSSFEQAKADTFNLNLDNHTYSVTVNLDPYLSSEQNNPTTNIDMGTELSISSSPLNLDVCGNLQPKDSRIRVYHDGELIGEGALGDTFDFNALGPCDQTHEVRYEVTIFYEYIRGDRTGETGQTTIDAYFYYKPNCDVTYQCIVNKDTMAITSTNPNAACGSAGLADSFKILDPDDQQESPEKDDFCKFDEGTGQGSSVVVVDHADVNELEEEFAKAFQGESGADDTFRWKCQADASGQADLVTCYARVVPGGMIDITSIQPSQDGQCVDLDPASWPAIPQSHSDFCKPNGTKVVNDNGNEITGDVLVPAPDSGQTATWNCSGTGNKVNQVTNSCSESYTTDITTTE
ncbi:MAG: hypothetical protein GF332_01860 [Candidatus Moranbacteria bacterium]|nr:hypothetical protein [Candidatus Moranbacteria bacterium]